MVSCGSNAGNVVTPLKKSFDINDVCKALSLPQDAQVAQAMAEVLVAREQRMSAVGVAECMVRMKELDAVASVENTRTIELGSTERCRIQQEQKSMRMRSIAEVMDRSVKERAATQRLTVTEVERTKRTEVAAHERVETVRAQVAASKATSLRFVSALALVVTLSVRSASRPRLRVSTLTAFCFCAWLLLRRSAVPSSLSVLLRVVLAHLVPGVVRWPSVAGSRACVGNTNTEETPTTAASSHDSPAK
eukprot:TRINITY_DN64833_c0_g1_i1.p1 TRINITY_DN64833_c0_g1~~TRINITY_DN64833_c0_g1_i1.p1  ORF type:complete len:282 (-),score=37.48 TRINITY_DN64833_c0_g1_i1:391-1134(-)